MKLWLIQRTDRVGWDEYDSAVVAADDEVSARSINPDGSGRKWGDRYSSWCKSPELVDVTLLGTAKRGTEAGVILASFNAG